MARIKVVCRGCNQNLLIWGTHDDLIVNLTTERLARAVRCHTCGNLLDNWAAVKTIDKAQLQGNPIMHRA